VTAFRYPLNRYIALPGEDDLWRLEEDLQLLDVSVGSGFEHDYASVPKIVRSVVDRCGRGGPAAIAHDFLYRECGHLGRKYCDQFFRDGLAVLGVNWAERQAAYWGVRAGGWVAWNKHRKAEKNA